MKRLVRVFSESEIEKAESFIVPEDRRIIVELTCDSITGSTIPKIPQDEADPNYPEAERQFQLFYASVLKFLRTISEITIVDRGTSQTSGSVSVYLRFTIDDPQTGSPVHYLFELRISDHLLPEDWVVFSLSKLREAVKRYEASTGDYLEPAQFDFHVGYLPNGEATHGSYEDALKNVQNIIKSIVKSYIGGK
jgi:hypothetical protein